MRHPAALREFSALLPELPTPLVWIDLLRTASVKKAVQSSINGLWVVPVVIITPSERSAKGRDFSAGQNLGLTEQVISAIYLPRPAAQC